MKFNKKILYYFIAACLAFSLGKGIDFHFNENRLLNKYVDLIEENINTYHQEIQEKLAQTDFFLYQSNDKKLVDEETSYFAKRHYNICLYQKDSLIFWSNSIAFPPKDILQKLRTSQQPIFTKLSNGYFVLLNEKIPNSHQKDLTAISLIPIKWEYNKNITNLKANFEAGNLKKIPGSLEVSSKASNFPIHLNDGTIIGYLHNTTDFKDRNVLLYSLLLYLIGFIFLAIVLNLISLKLTESKILWLGPAFLLTTVFGIRFFSQDWSLKYQTFEIFRRTFDNTKVSLGDLLINIILLLWIVIFIHREAKTHNISSKISNQVRALLTVMNYLSVVLALLMIISVIKSLVLNLDFTFGIKNILNLDQYSLLSTLGIVLLLFTQFIFSHRLMTIIHQLGLSKGKRLLAQMAAIAIAIPIIYLIDLNIPIPILALLALVLLLTFDLFIDINNPGVIWLVCWVILFSAISSGLLYKYNLDKDVKIKLNIAHELAKERDSIAEKSIFNLAEALEEKFISQNPANLEERIADLFFNQSYLYDNYQYTLYGFDHKGQPFFDNQATITEETLNFKFKNSQKVIGESLFFYGKEPNNQNYFLNIKSLNDEHPDRFASIILEISYVPKKKATVYTDILYNHSYKGLDQLGQYDYAVIKNGVSIKDSGKSADHPDYDFPSNPEIGGFVEATGAKEPTSNFLYRFGDKDFIILSTEKNNLFHPVSLFSFIFLFLTIIVLGFSIINSKFNILPDNFNFNFWRKPSLKNRIQFSTVALILASFIIIGFISVYFLRDNYINYDRNRLNRKSSSVLANAEQFLRLEKDSIEFLQRHIKVLANTHRIDVNLFDRAGNLIQSSKEDIFNKGIIPPKMSARAYEYLEKYNLSDNIQLTEYIGNSSFVTAFLALKDSDNNKIAYLGIPYSNTEKNLDDDVALFMSNLINVYVLLLLIAGGISILVANTITRPISTIGEKLKEIKFGKSNEPLEWGTNDEIGALITEYNRMILKLDHSAKLLARSEREGAWREMAKQVAHEIKNPLTPMKLSIQYLQHAYKSNPDNIEPLMKRVSKTLIEQIDSLAQIANEFSSFAKMPRANNQQIMLNHLVESVYDLFKESKGMEVSLSLPESEFYVFADKNHVVRVLNNMIKNAVEAIPDSRNGKIEVSLYKDNTTAVIKVEDNGVGIPDDMKEKVFVPNFTTKNSGTGLGLAISKNIIESVNGKIYFETEANVGTRFYVELPLEDMVI